MKRFLALILALTLSFSLCISASAAGQTFEDVPPSHWAFSQIEEAFRDGAVGGTYYDEATGVRRYSPDSTLTLAQLITILTRAFYGPELAGTIAIGSWYAANLTVAEKHNLLEGVQATDINANASRYDMAAIIANVLRDNGVVMPTIVERGSVMDKIADWGDIPMTYRGYVCDVYYMGIIGGIDTAGTFNGRGVMTRAQMAAVYVRIKNTIANSGGGTVKPENPAQPEKPDAPTAPSSGIAAFGTISDAPVTLSFDTHSVDFLPVDYWAEQSEDIKNLTREAREAFNATVHSMIHSEKIAYEGQFGTGRILGNINLYYNYAVYKPSYTQRSAVENAIQQPLYFHAPRIGLASNNGLWLVTAIPNEQLDTIFAQYLRHISPGMTDRAKVKTMLSFIVDKFSYGAGGGATWTNGKTVGDCDDYFIIVGQLLSAAGIPNIRVTGQTSHGAHAWNQVYLPDEGKWIIVDGTDAEQRGVDFALFEFAAYESRWGIDSSKNQTDQIKVARALIETACRYSN